MDVINGVWQGVKVVIHEADSYVELPRQVLEIKKESMRMITFLDEETGPDATKFKADQLTRVRDLLDDVEDILDMFTYTENMGRCVGSSRLPRTVWGRRQIATRIRELNVKWNDLSNRLRLYTSPCHHSHHDSEVVLFESEAALFLDEGDLVGIEVAKQELDGYIDNGDSQRTTTSLVGMGGSGKTTLAGILFKSLAVKKFHCSAWITVSRTFNIEQLLRDLIKKINKTTRSEAKIEAEGLSRIKYRELAEKLKGYLEDKTYLVVLDDVWTSDVWSRIKIALPDGKNKSRVILTARTRDNISEASLEPGSYVYEVQPLDVTKAMELFCSRAFSSSRNSAACPRNLRGTADTILEKCKGLPIAIDSIGRLLAKKEPSLKAWTTTLDDLQFELSKNKLPLNSVLLLSYNDLPYRLKRCFLYFALFPEDHKIWCGKLVNLWMAEGFLEPGENNGGSTPEDVGMRYIRELIGRNVLQAVRWDLYGDHGMCRMHDLYRDIALQISDKENFCSLYTLGTSFPTQDSISNHGRRRVSIHGESNESDVIISPEASKQTEAGADMEGDFWNRSSWKEVIIPPDATDVIKLVKGMKHLRSLLLFVKGNPFSLTELGWADHRLLRVLDMENAPVFALSKDIDVLYNLKFLSLSHTKIKSLANTIENLASLETLDVTSTDVKSLPSEIIKLENLRHLLAGNLRFGRLLTYDGLKGVKVPSGTDISSLKKLQALRLVEANEEIVQQLRKMTQLVQLGITNVGQAQMVDLCSALKKMLLLRWLVVIASTEHEILQMDSLGESSSSAPPLQRLEYLILCGQLNNIPNWIHSLPSLTTIRLVWSRLPVEIDPAMHLQGMDRLKNLWLQNAYVGSELKFLSGFKSLRALAFGNLPNLETLTIGEEGVMPNLRIMTVRDCPNLKNISPGIQFLSKLKELTLENVPNELVERIRGRDHANFQHIHIIWCRYKSTDNRLTTEIL